MADKALLERALRHLDRAHELTAEAHGRRVGGRRQKPGNRAYIASILSIAAHERFMAQELASQYHGPIYRGRC